MIVHQHNPTLPFLLVAARGSGCNAFSKKLENHAHAFALYFRCYNSCRVHQTLRLTPALEAGLTNHIWSIEELMALLG